MTKIKIAVFCGLLFLVFLSPASGATAKYVKTSSWMQYGHILSVYEKCTYWGCDSSSGVPVLDQKLNNRKVGDRKSINISTGFRPLDGFGGGTNGKVIVFTGSYSTQGV
jgi:hypothetical protein